MLGRASQSSFPLLNPVTGGLTGLLVSLEASVPTPPSEQGPVSHLLKDAIIPHFVRRFIPHDQNLQGGKYGAGGLGEAVGLASKG